MEKTHNLKLTLPTSGQTNWGQSYNNNFKTLDQKYFLLISQMENLRKQMGSLGLYYVDDYYKPELIVQVEEQNTGDGNHYIVTDIRATLTEDPDTDTSLMSDPTGNEDFDVLFPYTMFMIKRIETNEEDPKDRKEITDKVRYYFGKEREIYEEWETDDYIVKYNEFYEAQTTGYWKRMPQTVGGYYLPDEQYVMNGNVPTLGYTKIPALEADANETIKRGALHARVTSIKENAITFSLYSGSNELVKEWQTYNYPTLEESGSSIYEVNKNTFTFKFQEQFIVSDVRFFTKTDSSQIPVYLYYTITPSDKKVTITIDRTYILTGEQVFMQLKFAKQGQLGVVLE